jgi:hypothetical protein
MTVYKKLIEVQKELKAPKNQRNSFGNYNYRSCEDILEALKPVLSEHGATVFISDKPVVKENLWSYIEATATFVDTESGDSVSVTAYAREAEMKKGMDVSQITGSASSYARKYALNGLFLIDDTRDADTDEQHLQTTGAKQKAFSKDDVTALRLDLVKVATATKKDVNDLESWVAQQIGLNSFEAINQSSFAKANALVKQLMAKAKV